MNIVNPINTSHKIRIIPRWEVYDFTLQLYNEILKENIVFVSNFSSCDGYLDIYFDYNFTEGDSFQIKITDAAGGIAYRGKIFATEQDTQNYRVSTNAYIYE